MARAVLASLPLVASDLLALLASLLVPWMLIWSSTPGLDVNVALLLGLLAAGLVPAHAALRLYPGFGVHSVVELERSVIASTLLFGAFILSDYLDGEGWGFRGFLLTAGAMNALVAPILRSLTRRTVSRFAWWKQPLLVLGSGSAAQRVSDYFARNPVLGFEPVSLNGDQEASGHVLSHHRVLQEPHTLAWLAERHNALCAAVPLNGDDTDRQEFLLEQCANVFPRLLIVPEPDWLPDFWTGPADVGGAVGQRMATNLLSPFARAAKRIMDWSLAVPITVLALPLFALIALAVRATSPGPVIYGSVRIGRGRRRFKTWKFRTMYVNADELLNSLLRSDDRLRDEWAKTQKLRSDPRITPVGRWLRKFSLDELPQLWNVLCGDMSLVGPRPVIPPEVSRRGKDVGLYLSVRPGLTGLWQISGRSMTSYQERIRLDSYYVRNWSPWLDLHILVRTVRVVLSGYGAH